ncbi:MAG: T9SS type A sorting domain-containing protein, partial [Candidatus Nanoarchaeia archaeon]
LWKELNDQNNRGIIKEYILEINYPNPFNPSTQIRYQIPSAVFVNLTVYNSLGQTVAKLVNEYQSEGRYSVEFDANDLPSGIYFYKIQAGPFSDVKKMLLTK